MSSILPEYVFYFQDIDTTNHSLTKLQYDLDGWKNYGVSFGRETNISNIVKSYTQSWKFFKDDAAYLKRKLFAYGPNRRIRLIIKSLTDFMRETYKIEYAGYIDLTQIVIEADCVSVPVAEAGFFKALENKWREEYSLPLDSICNVTGASFAEEVEMLNEESTENEECTRYATIGYVLLGGSIQNTESVSEEFFQDTTLRYLNAYLDLNSGDRLVDSVSETDAFFMMRSNIIQSMKITFDCMLQMDITDFHTFAGRHRSKYRLYLVSTDYANVENGASVVLQNGVNADFIPLQYIQEIHTLINGWGAQRFSVNFNGEHTLTNYDCSSGKVFFLLACIYYGDPSWPELWGNNNLDWDTRYPASVSSSDTPHSTVSLSYTRYNVRCSFETQIIVDRRVSVIPSVRVFKALIEKIGNGYNVQLQLAAFEHTAKDDLLASGSGLRGVRERKGYYNPQGHLATSLDKFLQYCMVVYNYRLGVDYDRDSDTYTVYLAHYDTFFKSDSCIATLKAINKFSVSIDRDKLYSSIRCGYETQDDAINGLSEYNCIFNWLTPNTQIEEKELELVSPYSASTRTIETYIFENYDNEKDSAEKDNDVFLIGGKWKEWKHADMVNFAELPLIDEIGQRWNDVLVVNNNPSYNGGYSFVAYEWYLNNFDEVLGTGPYLSGLNLSNTSNVYFCLLTTSDNRHFLTMFPFDAAYEVPAQEEEWMDDVEQYVLRRDIAVTAGLLQPQNAWNIDFTPKRILLAHLKELFSYFSFERGKCLTLNTSERNSELIAGGLTEAADVVIGEEPLFLPILMEVSTPVGKGLISEIERNRMGYFRFEFQGKVFKGFIAEGSDSVSVNPMAEKESTIKLIAGKECKPW